MIRVLLSFLVLFFYSSLSHTKEIFDLDYNNLVVGSVKYIKSEQGESIPGLTIRYDTGYHELLSANPNNKKWFPKENTTFKIPSMYILPQKSYKGLILNLSEMRLYYYMSPEDLYEVTRVVTFPVSIGRNDWKTPLGETTIIHKVENPIWYPPQSIIDEHKARGDDLPKIVPPGSKNPLGKFALDLELPGYLLHGTNRPQGIGMMVTHGCIRLRDNAIKTLFYNAKIGTRVKIINEPIKVGTLLDELYIEVHDFEENYKDIALEEVNINSDINLLKPLITFLNNNPNYKVNWEIVFKSIKSSHGIPVIVGKKSL